MDREKIDTEMVIKAIEHCKTCQCNGCPFKGRGSCCVAVLEYLIKSKRARANEEMKDGDGND